MATCREGVFRRYKGGVTSRAECAAARPTTERLDLLGMAVLAISDQGVDPIIGDAEVRALGVETGMALRIHASGGLLAGFSPLTRDATSAVPAPNEGAEARRQAGQSSGERGFSKRGSLLRSLPVVLDGAGPRWGQLRAHSSAREKKSMNTSRNTWTFMKHSLYLKWGGGTVSF